MTDLWDLTFFILYIQKVEDYSVSQSPAEARRLVSNITL